MTTTLTGEAPVIDGDAAALNAVLLRVRLLVRRRLLWLTGPGAGEGGELAALLEDRDDPAAEQAWRRGQHELEAQIGAVEQALATDSLSRLVLLTQVFALNAFERDLLQICLAATIDPSLGRLYAYCHDDRARAYPSLALVARLCGHGRSAPWSTVSPLRRWGLVRADLAEGSEQLAPLALDPAIGAWLAGVDEPDPLLVGRAQLVPPREPLPEWPVARTADFVTAALADDPSRPVVVQVLAPSGGGRKTFAACVATRLGMPLLAINLAAIPEELWEHVFVRAQRQAFLQQVALAWVEPGGEGAVPRRWPELVAHFPLQFVLRQSGGAVAAHPRASELRVELPPPQVATRLRLWAEHAPQAVAADPQGVQGLAERFNARPGAIAAASAVPGASAALMAQALRDSRRELLGGLAQPLETPFAWDDLVLGAPLREAMGDFVHEARDQALFWEQPEARRLFPQGRGLAALFSGPPGTGKTMAAQVIAAQLGLDLFRIDLSAVVSKYVGETAHNLQRILSRAAELDVVLFFDEADALFARRTEVKDAHDRFANTDTNHLLQALESYGGLAILATNRKGNIDPAFIRRLRYVFEFARPDRAQRRELWERLLGALAGAAAVSRLEPLLDRLAVELELTGAQIKGAALTACFAARREGGPLLAAHLMRGLDREMAKEGRALSERERARLA